MSWFKAVKVPIMGIFSKNQAFSLSNNRRIRNPLALAMGSGQSNIYSRFRFFMEYTNYIDKKNIKKILVIKCRALGDVLLSTPVFTNLKNYFHAEIDAFIYSDSLEILKNNQYINNIISYDLSIKKLNFFKKIVKEIKFILKVRKKNYDLIINLTEGDRGDILAFFSKAKY